LDRGRSIDRTVPPVGLRLNARRQQRAHVLDKRRWPTQSPEGLCTLASCELNTGIIYSKNAGTNWSRPKSIKQQPDGTQLDRGHGRRAVRR
jgi:hypothetical protein